MRKPVVVEGEPITVEEVARLGNVSPERTAELVALAHRLVASRPVRPARSNASGKAATKRAPAKTRAR